MFSKQSFSFMNPTKFLRSQMTQRELRLKFLATQVALNHAERILGPNSAVVAELNKTAEMLWDCTDGQPLKRQHVGG